MENEDVRVENSSYCLNMGMCSRCVLPNRTSIGREEPPRYLLSGESA